MEEIVNSMNEERLRERMQEMVTSFRQKINSMEEKSRIRYVRPTIVSRSHALTERVQSHRRPSLVSIGPLHRRDVNLEFMEDLKWSFLYVSGIGSLSSEELYSAFCGLKESEERVRRAYSRMVDMTSDDFVQMLFLDACFLIFLTLAELDEDAERDAVIQAERDVVPQSSLNEGQRRLLLELNTIKILAGLESLNVKELNTDVKRDLFILENQIPFFVLEYLWEWLKTALDIQSSLDYRGCHSMLNRVTTWRLPEDIYHYLHLHHCCYVPPPSTDCELQDRYVRSWIPSAETLKDSNIHFELIKPIDRRNISLNITFLNGVLSIPETFLDEDVRAMVENMVDFEQSVPREHLSTAFSNYVWIMSCILSNEKDLSILGEESSHKYEKVWDKDVQRFFKDLEKRCFYWKVDPEIKTMSEHINVYRSSKRHEWKTIFQLKFCSNPWITLSVTGAIALFLFVNNHSSGGSIKF